MFNNESEIQPVKARDFFAVIGEDFRKLPDTTPHYYDPAFFQELCGKHDGYVLHPIDSRNPASVLDIAETVFELVETDNHNEIDDHDLGTLSDDYTSIGRLVDSMQYPSLLTQDVSRHVICGAREGIIGRLDYQPALVRSEDNPEMEVSLWVADPFREQNISSYVLNRFITDIFHDRENLLVLRAQVLVGNIAARKLVEQAGFQMDGLIIEDDLEPYQNYVLLKPTEN